MKNFIKLLLFSLLPFIAQAGRNITLKTTAANTIRYSDMHTANLIDTANVSWGHLQAGDTLRIPTSTTYQDFALFNMIDGTDGNEVVIMKSGPGQLIIKRGTLSTSQPNPARFSGHHWKLLGNTDPALQYGIVIGGFNTTNNYSITSLTLNGGGGVNCYNFEIAGVEFTNTGRGLFMNPSSGNSMPHIKIHDCYWHDLTFGTCVITPDCPSCCTSECVYFGLSNAANYNAAPRLSDVEFYNNRFENVAGDGIQIKFASNVRIHDNYFYRTGFGLSGGQGDGVQIGEFTDTVNIYNNIFDSCSQHAVLNKGCGPQKIHKNIFRHISNKGGTNDVIYLNASDPKVTGPGKFAMLCDSNSFVRDTIGHNLINNASTLSLQDTGVYIQNCDTSCVSLTSSLYATNSKDKFTVCTGGSLPPDPVYINQEFVPFEKKKQIRRHKRTIQVLQ